MDPTRPLKHKRSFSGRVREKVSNLFGRSPSPSPQQPSRPPTAQSTSSPLPSGRLSLSPRLVSTPALAPQAIVAPQGSAQALLASDVDTLALEGSTNNLPTIIVSPVTTEPTGGAQVPENPITPANPVPTSQSTSSGLWTGLGIALRALHTSAHVFPPLQSAIDAFIPCLDILEGAARNRQEYEELAAELTSLTELLAQHMKQSNSARMSGSIANVARSIKEQAKLIENKRARGTGRQLMEAGLDGEELGKYYRRIGSLFRQLQADANLSIWNIVNDQTTNIRLERLKPAMLATHDSKLSQGISRRTCTANTRTAILSGLDGWSCDPSGANIYWMNGMAGTGKTTIACSFSESLEERKQLAASFFCTRTAPECREVTRIIPTIAYQLAQYSVPFQAALCESLGENPNVSSKNVMKQFEPLLKNPLLKVKDAIPNDLVVVIDALDECDDMREVELLLTILLKSVAEVPIKFFVTSRPEPKIYERMLARGYGSHATLHLHEVEESLVQADIEVYLGEELEFMSPAPAQIRELARRSGNLFIYAATLVRYIRSRKPQTNPQRRLQAVLDMTSEPTKQYATIDALYAAVLQAALEDDSEELEAHEVDDVRRVLQTAICIQEPVSIEVLAVLAGVDDEQRVLSALQPLRSVLHLSETTGLVSTLHASFPDFMFDKARSNWFSCNFAERSQVLAQRCFEVMKVGLKFNICELESSFAPDNMVDNLEERVKKAISPALWYACRYWGDHLRHSAYSDLLCTTLGGFLSDQLLFWMEVLNLKKGISLGAEVLLKAKLWLKIGTVPPGVVRLTEDARNFVTSFAANPIAQSTPHIYISLLPFCSQSSSVFKQYSEKTHGLMKVTGSAMRRRDTAALACWKMESGVESVAYSPDGSCLAVGCSNGTISIRSANDGALVAGPLKGHAGTIWSVAYSPDGARIISGSKDGTIRVWSAYNGRIVAGPFEGHTDTVWSVAYSPDGTRIVSGSGDRTIRVWNADDGTLVAEPFKGHTDAVWWVAYSPNGTRIVSGSTDHTIRIWSARDGTLLAGPLKGHTDSVRSLAYSPDGTRIVSGSKDHTIRVWSANDGTLVASPFEGHTDSVWSVVYSPDGTRIVSGSGDRTIRVWSADDGTLVAGPFEGHSDPICSVAYSLDGTRIVSGSDDHTVRVWSAYDGAFVASQFEGHTSSVWSVAYSPDGTRIVSGSDDHTIRVWSAQDGTLVTGPFEGHTDVINSVAYSPDGTHIVSGSGDHTIRTWSTHGATLVAGLFEGHTDIVWSVAYSPNGTRIVSGSDDHTIRVWNVQDGTLIASPFEGHTGSVLSVAYSPDGTHIASGSKDCTIRVWSAHDGALIAGPFLAHTDWVRSVTYSPDGKHIGSASDDGSVRVWGAQSGRIIASPFEGYTGWIRSVAYSSDGAHIVSGSNDHTIRVWNPQDGMLIAGPLEGHTSSVCSVAYSPDGTHIVSSSDDCTIRVWRVLTSPSLGTQLVHIPRANDTFAPSLSGPVLTTSTPDRPNAAYLPNPNHGVLLNSWTIQDDGWVIGADTQLLFWVPFEFAQVNLLPTFLSPLTIAPDGSLRIDFSDMLLGEYWDRIYRPK